MLLSNPVQAAVPCGAVGPIMFGSLSVPWSDDFVFETLRLCIFASLHLNIVFPVTRLYFCSQHRLCLPPAVQSWLLSLLVISGNWVISYRSIALLIQCSTIFGFSLPVGLLVNWCVECLHALDHLCLNCRQDVQAPAS